MANTTELVEISDDETPESIEISDDETSSMRSMNSPTSNDTTPHIPDTLFRVITNSSHGTNTTKLLAPAGSSTTLTNGETLQAALLGRDLPDCPFVFLTSSLLFALHFANWRMKQGEGLVRILCVQISTAKTADGRIAQFRSVDALMDEWGVALTNRRDNSKRDYPGEYVAMSTVIPGEGSCYVSFDTLVENGLYKLYPELEEVGERSVGKLYVAMSILRDYWISATRALTEEKIDTAARLAFSFYRCDDRCNNLDPSKAYLGRILSWFLALQKRDTRDPALNKWLKTYTTKNISTSQIQAERKSSPTNMPEVGQYEQLKPLFTNRQILKNEISLQSTISSSDVQRARLEYDKWSEQKRAERRVSRPPRTRPNRRDGVSGGRKRDGYRVNKPYREPRDRVRRPARRTNV